MMLNRLVRSKLTTSQKTLPQLPDLANATCWAQGSPAPASPAPRQGCISQVHRGHHRPSPRYAHNRLRQPKNTHSPPPRWAEVPLITVPTPALPCIPAKQILERSTPGADSSDTTTSSIFILWCRPCLPTAPSFLPSPGQERSRDFTLAVGLPCSPERLLHLQWRELLKRSRTVQKILTLFNSFLDLIWSRAPGCTVVVHGRVASQT